jgi:protein-tyrosine phosphatase
MAMFKKILVVCVGNICRSPTAECLLHAKLTPKGFEVSSAGISALVDHPMDKTAHEILQQNGYIWDQHKARQLTRDIIQENDLILVMEKGHLKAVTDIAPEARGKTFLLSKWLEGQDITDPYRQSKTLFELVYKLIDKACDGWEKRLV